MPTLSTEGFRISGTPRLSAPEVLNAGTIDTGTRTTALWIRGNETLSAFSEEEFGDSKCSPGCPPLPHTPGASLASSHLHSPHSLFMTHFRRLLLGFFQGEGGCPVFLIASLSRTSEPLRFCLSADLSPSHSHCLGLKRGPSRVWAAPWWLCSGRENFTASTQG